MKRIILMVLLVVSGTLFAQEFRATLTGRVTDPSGAVIPGAEITVTNTDTGVIVNTKSDRTGNYTVPFLLPGHYSVQASASGFNSITELTFGPALSMSAMRCKYFCASDRDVHLPDFRPACRSAMVSSSSANGFTGGS